MDASHRGPVVNMSNYDFFVIGMHKLSNKQSYVEKSLQYGDCFFWWSNYYFMYFVAQNEHNWYGIRTNIF